MKKHFLFVCLLTCLFMFISCKQEDKGQAKLNVVVTNFALYDFARIVAGIETYDSLTVSNDSVSIKMLTATANHHSYDLKAQDIVDIEKADVFLYIGGHSDTWLNKTLENLNVKNSYSFIDSGMEAEYLEHLHEHGKEQPNYYVEDHNHDEHNHDGEEHEHEHGEEDEYDEHIWTNPKTAISMVSKIANVFGEKDSANREYYVANANKYIKELTSLDSLFKSIVQNAKRKTIVFGDQFPFKHFVDEYNLKYYSAFPGCTHETEPSAAAVAFIIDKIKKEKIPVVFHIENSNKRVINTIVEATKAKPMLLHAVHDLSSEDIKAKETYLSLMKRNAETLREALSN